MEAVAWVTVVLGALIVAAAALGLVRVIGHLMAVDRTLAQVLGGVRVIAEETSTIPTVVPSVNQNLAPVRDFCDSIREE